MTIAPVRPALRFGNCDKPIPTPQELNTQSKKQVYHLTPGARLLGYEARDIHVKPGEFINRPLKLMGDLLVEGGHVKVDGYSAECGYLYGRNASLEGLFMPRGGARLETSDVTGEISSNGDGICLTDTTVTGKVSALYKVTAMDCPRLDEVQSRGTVSITRTVPQKTQLHRVDAQQLKLDGVSIHEKPEQVVIKTHTGDIRNADIQGTVLLKPRANADMTLGYFRLATTVSVPESGTQKGPRLALTNTRVDHIRAQRTAVSDQKSKKPVIVSLGPDTRVRGDIRFDDENGLVLIKPDASIDGQVSGGRVVRLPDGLLGRLLERFYLSRA